KWGALPADGDWNMDVQLGEAKVPLRDYVMPTMTAWQDITIPVSAFTRSKPDLDLTRISAITLAATGHYRQRCLLYLAALDVVPSAARLKYTEFVKVDQVGYTPAMPEKMAIVSYEPGTVLAEPSMFRVVDARSGKVVYKGPLVRVKARPDWDLDGDVVFHANFGALQTPGTYRVEAPELHARSQPFRIASDVYNSVFRDSLRYFYYSRSGEPIVAPFAEGYPRPIVHADSRRATYNYAPARGRYAYRQGETRDVHGCWLDAGDTHVQVPSTATACWYLLETARDFGAKVRPGSLDLPESRAGRGDMVPLIFCALDWLKRMQDPDGGVHHYIVSREDGILRVSDVSSFATALAAATYAKACAVLGASLTPQEAADLLHRARQAWSWLLAHPEVVRARPPLQNGVDPGGEDAQWSWGDDAARMDRWFRAFAAVELFEATGEPAFNAFFLDLFHKNGGSPLYGPIFGSNTTGYDSDRVLDYPNWLNFAFLDYIRSRRSADRDAQSTLRSAFLHQAEVLKRYMEANAYRVPLLYPGHLYWGSNGGVVAPAAMIFMRAYSWTGNADYRKAAMNALHWICGRNPVDRVFVSGYGDYQHGSDFYSQFWTDLRHQPPGYLGGNINVEGSAKPVVEHPWKRFLNTQDADMTEPGVYWNSAFAWLAGCFAASTSHPSSPHL
ncbi:MAG TPA: glycoside hydrolase family 9 protein, partial [Chthonomonadaceae bacterium]|nr:glycoside hydrolase family 9 protein [Chthonomonadaceae bacterium]